MVNGFSVWSGPYMCTFVWRFEWLMETVSYVLCFSPRPVSGNRRLNTVGMPCSQRTLCALHPSPLSSALHRVTIDDELAMSSHINTLAKSSPGSTRSPHISLSLTPCLVYAKFPPDNNPSPDRPGPAS